MVKEQKISKDNNRGLEWHLVMAPPLQWRTIKPTPTAMCIFVLTKQKGLD